MDKRFIILFMILFCLISLTGCKSKIDNFEGKWKEINPSETWHEATIKEGIIEIYWVSNDMNALYWRGTYEAPDSAVSEYEWTSLNRIPEDQFFMMASDATSKQFKYEDGYLTYEASAFGVTKVVRLVLIEKYEKSPTQIENPNINKNNEFSLTMNIIGTIIDNKISLNVCEQINNFSFIDVFNIPSNFKWELHYEQECLPELNIASKTINIVNKVNEAYALFINKNNNDDIHLYKIIITKECEFDSQTIKEPTCYEIGEKIYSCKYNSKHIIKQEIQKLEHREDSNGNCTNGGCNYQKYGPYYTITLNCDGDLSKYEKIEVQNNRPYNLPNPTKEGFEFLGWYLGDKQIISGVYQYTNDITLVARWKEIKSSNYEYVFPQNIGTNSNLIKFTEYTNGEIKGLNIINSSYQFSRWSEYYNETYASIDSISSNYNGFKYSDLAGENKKLYAILKFTCDNIVYEIIGDNEVAVIGVVTYMDTDGLRKYDDTLTIPNKVLYDNCEYDVTTIYDFCYPEISRLFEINLPKSIKVIFGEATSLIYDLKILNFEKGTHLKAIYGGIKQIDFIVLPKTETIIDYYTSSHSIIIYEGIEKDFVYTTSDTHYQKKFIEYNVDINDIQVIYNEKGIFTLENGVATLIKIASSDSNYEVPTKINYNDNNYDVVSINNGAFINSYVENIFINSNIEIHKDSFWQYNFKSFIFIESDVDTSSWENGWDNYTKNVYFNANERILIQDGITYYVENDKASIISVSNQLSNIILLDKVTINNKEYLVENIREGLLNEFTNINELHLYSNAKKIIEDSNLAYIFSNQYGLETFNICRLYIHGFSVSSGLGSIYSNIEQIVFDYDVENIAIDFYESNITKFIIIENPNAIVEIQEFKVGFDYKKYDGLIFCHSQVKFNSEPQNVVYGYVNLDIIGDYLALFTRDGVYLLDYFGSEKNLVIPSVINYYNHNYNVVGIMDKCFEYPQGKWADSIFIPSTIMYIYGRPFIGHAQMHTIINVEHSSKPENWDSCWNFETYTEPWYFNVNWNVIE